MWDSLDNGFRIAFENAWEAYRIARRANVIAVIADIHGNLPALEAVLDDMPEVSEIWALGDFVTGAPYPCEVLERLLGLPVPARSVLGNQDEALLQKRGQKKTRQFGIHQWVEESLLPRHWAFLEGLGKSLAVEGALLFHGTPEEAGGAVITQGHAEQLARAYGYRWLAGGHRHQARYFRMGGQGMFIPGAVGLSVDRMGGMAAYALLDGDKLSFRYVPYDAWAVAAKMEKHPVAELAPGVARCVRQEILTGRCFMMSLVRHAFGCAEKQLGCRPDEIPGEIWDEAERTWDGSEYLVEEALCAS